jgi:hypothetical protein
MGSLSDALRQECAALVGKSTQTGKALDEGANLVIDQAEQIAENIASFGDGARELFDACERTMLLYVKASSEHKGHQAALRSFPDKVESDASPATVQKAFVAEVRESATDVIEDYEPLRKLRKIVKDALDSGPGPSYAGDDDDLGEDGFSMTQAARSTKCPLLQLEMEATGELRPMRAPCGHVWSHKGITQFLRSKRGAVECPTAGCSQIVSINALVDDKELAKQIRQKR